MCSTYKKSVLKIRNKEQYRSNAQSCARASVAVSSALPIEYQNHQTARARARVSVKPCHRIRVALFPRQRSWIARRWWCPVRVEGWLRRGDRRPFRRACGTATSRRRVGRFDPADPFPNLPAGNSAGSWNAGGQAKRAYPAIRLCLFRPPSRPNRTTRADGSCACTAAAVVKGSDWLADTRPAKPREWRRCRDVVVGVDASSFFTIWINFYIFLI